MARRKIAKLRILVTGASQGIGRPLAVAAAPVARVLAAARSADLLAELAGEVRASGATIETVTADVTSAADRHKMVETAQRTFGGLDVLINNAGIGATGHFVEAAPQRLRSLDGSQLLRRDRNHAGVSAALAHGQSPAIVNISSIAGKRAIPARSEYSASKFAIQGFSEALRRAVQGRHRRHRG